MVGSLTTSLAVQVVAIVTPAAWDSSLKALTLAASESSRNALKSGVGEGVYERSDRTPNGKPIQYAARVYHHGPKFHVELTYLGGGQPWNMPSKLVVIYDGETLACREVNAQMRPFGEEARLYPSTDGNPRRIAPVLFHFNPARLQASVLDLPNALRNRPDMAFTVGPREVSASFTVGKEAPCRVLVGFPKAAGFNVGSFEVVRDDNGYRQLASAKWDRSGGAWYVREVETAFFLPGKGREYQRLTYSSYKANAEIDPALFRLPALGLVKGARLIHINAQSEAVDCYTHDPPAGTGKAGDSLLDGLRVLPLRNWIRPVAPAPRAISPPRG